MARVKDHHGKEFPDVRAMCAYHGVSTGSFYRAKSRGEPLAACLAPRRTHYRFRGHTFRHKEGLLAYAGVSRYEDIAHLVTEIVATD